MWRPEHRVLRLRTVKVQLACQADRVRKIDPDFARAHPEEGVQVLRSSTDPHLEQVRSDGFAKNRSKIGGNCVSMLVSSKNSS